MKVTVAEISDLALELCRANLLKPNGIPLSGYPSRPL
jgi:hypothetical protein